LAVVSLSHIVKRYPGAKSPSVDNVSFTVSDGEFMVLLGPSGCGKSTTLRMIAGLESITGGDMAIDGRVVNDVPAMDRDIAMVFQSYALYPHMTVADNLAFGLKRRKVDAAQIAQRVRVAADILGLSELLQRKPFALSGGQRQRVALGRAIVREPKVFLFDEPLSNLDAALRVNTRNELVRLHHRLAATMILRDPRPGRGDDDGTAHLRHEPGPGGADRQASGRLPPASRRLRRALPGQPADEPGARARD
jgi:multiple sugar transport system ATP-binding protein